MSKTGVSRKRLAPRSSPNCCFSCGWSTIRPSDSLVVTPGISPAVHSRALIFFSFQEFSTKPPLPQQRRVHCDLPPHFLPKNTFAFYSLFTDVREDVCMGGRNAVWSDNLEWHRTKMKYLLLPRPRSCFFFVFYSPRPFQTEQVEKGFEEDAAED
uniref:Uncharacterized protein TCIL3000_10_6130 n=1 Tax=Trypanosoma congolense (strain IL3000) TaxID=1068625 RepID=G0UWS3_TRYCI|nr:unnamed protein product [Trypanosoma congolense IL3000]